MEYGDQLPLAVTGIVGQVCANAPTLRGALQAQLRFTELLDPRLDIEHVEDGPNHRLGLSYNLPNPCIPHILEMLVTTTVRFARALSGARDAGPRRVYFHFARRHPTQAYESRTGCPALFDQGWTGIEFPAEFLDAPLPASQPDAQRYLVQHAEHLLNERSTAQASVATLVRRRVEATLTDGPPTADAMAAAVGLGPRTLQRRLESEKTSLSEIIDDTRRHRALALLRSPTLTAQEVAFALGYSDPRAFHRAFKRWTGQSPGQFRRSPGSPNNQ